MFETNKKVEGAKHHHDLFGFILTLDDIDDSPAVVVSILT
jgi:hypothetical protein